MVTLNTCYTLQFYTGLQADTKPLGVPNGSMFLEMDTGTLYRFDAENQTWINQANPTPSGGDEMFIVNITSSGGDTYVADKSFDNIVAAYEDGNTIVAIMKMESADTVHYLRDIMPVSGVGGVNFNSLATIDSSDGVSNTSILIGADDSVTVTSNQYPGHQ